MGEQLSSPRARRLVVAIALLAMLFGIVAPAPAAYAATPLTATPTPTIDGEARVGVTLTAVTGIWRPAIVTLAYQWYANGWGPDPLSYRYQWYKSGKAISGATAQIYVPTKSDAGARVTVKVTGTKPGFASVVRSSAASGKIASASTIPSVQLFSADAIGLGIQAAWSPSVPTARVTEYVATATPMAGTGMPACPSPVAVAVIVPSDTTGTAITGLCAEVVYTVRIAAIVGTAMGPSGAPSGPVVPLAATAPESPLLISALGRDGSTELAWRAPSYNGGAPLTSYRLVLDGPGDPIETTVLPAESSETIDGLENDAEYAIALTAITSAGESLPSTGTVVPRQTYLPGPPDQFSASPDGTGAVTLTWQAPFDDGGGAVSAYRISATQVDQLADGTWEPTPGADLIERVVLAPGTAAIVDALSDPLAFYRFEIRAENTTGVGDPAGLDNPLTPTVQLGSNTIVLAEETVAALDGSAATSLTWNAVVPPQVASITVGATLVADDSPQFPGGLLREVVAVSRTSARTLVTTIDGSLTDAFASASLMTNVDPFAPDEGNPPGGDASGGAVFARDGKFVPAMAGIRPAAACQRCCAASSPSVTSNSVASTASDNTEGSSSRSALPNGVST